MMIVWLVALLALEGENVSLQYYIQLTQDHHDKAAKRFQNKCARGAQAGNL
jgi:hypothetical protein